MVTLGTPHAQACKVTMSACCHLLIMKIPFACHIVVALSQVATDWLVMSLPQLTVLLVLQDVEQILNMHGLTATGASQVLANLHKLLAAAASA